MKKWAALLLFFMSFKVSSEELTPLALYIHAHPDYSSNSLETEYIANRCGALMNVLSKRTKEAGSSKEMKELSRHYERIGYSFAHLGLLLSKSPKSSEKKFTALHKELLKQYADITLRNWKSGNMFKGIISHDFDMCSAIEPSFEKLSKNLGQALKK